MLKEFPHISATNYIFPHDIFYIIFKSMYDLKQMRPPIGIIILKGRNPKI